MDELLSRDPEKVEAILDAVRRGDYVDPSGFARLTGTSEANVIRAWRDGRLPTDHGEIPVREGIVALVSLGAFKRGRGQVPEHLLRADGLARELLGLPPRDNGDYAPRVDQQPQDTDEELREWKLRYLKAQTAARAAAAAAKQRENDVKKGVLVSRADVELDAAECAANVSRALSRFPERVAGMCAGCSADEIAAILRREIVRVLDALQEAAFTGDWSGVS